MNKKLIVSSVITVFLSMPALIMAFNPGDLPNAAPGLEINTTIDMIFAILWPISVAFFIVMFIFASFKFALAQGNPEQLAIARNFLTWGIVGVVIAVLSWSVPFIVRNTLGHGI